MKIEVREAVTPADLVLARELMAEYGLHLANHPAGPEHFCISGIEAELAGLPERYATPGCILLAMVDGNTAGCVALKTLNGFDDALELKRLWVRPVFRTMGLGRRLMTAAIQKARAAGAAAIYLDTVPAAMPVANRLYATLGFIPVAPYNATRTPGIAFFRLDLRVGSV